MKKTALLSMAFLMLVSCEKSKKEEVFNEDSFPNEEMGKLDNKVVPLEILTLNTRFNEAEAVTHLDKNFFGKFYCDRAEFYIINNPVNEIHSAQTKSITLYFLDGELRQTKYILKEDISTSLLRKLGNFAIKGHDLKNRDIIKRGEVLIETQEGPMLNSDLDNFEMIWRGPEKEVNYKVIKKEGEQFIYYEKVKEYEAQFRNIRRRCV